MSTATSKEDFQKEIDNIYGVGEWRVKEYSNKKSPVIVEHKCGEKKSYSRAITFSTGAKKTCKKCQNQRNGRPRLTFEDLSKKIKDATNGLYELVSLVDSTSFVVNHKSCNRKPFKTNVSRFFSEGKRCQCSKIGVVGRKPYEHIK